LHCKYEIMKKVLNIIASPLGDFSNSNKLGNALLEKIKSNYPESEVTIRDLTESNIPHLKAAQVEAFFTPSKDHTESHKQSVQLSDQLIKEIFDADIIVMNVPTWNFSIPSSLKAWIDQITRSGMTFQYGDQGPVGLITGKKVYVAISSGAIFSEGQMKNLDFVEPYLRTILGFLGMTDVTVCRVEGLAMPLMAFCRSRLFLITQVNLLLLPLSTIMM